MDAYLNFISPAPGKILLKRKILGSHKKEGKKSNVRTTMKITRSIACRRGLQTSIFGAFGDATGSVPTMQK